MRADASATKPEQIENIQIDQRTRVGDIADVVYGPSELKSGLRFNGKTGVGVGIIRQAKSNTLDVSQGVRAAVAELNQTLPKGVSIVVTSDDATFIRGAIHEVIFTLVLATVIVIAIIYVFLRSLRITFIPAVTVPVALIGAFAAIWPAGFSVNILTFSPWCSPPGWSSTMRSSSSRTSRASGRSIASALAPPPSSAPPGLLRRARDHRDARARVRADLLLPRHRRAALLRVRLRPRLFGDALVLRRADAVADARLALDRRL